mmetsp:Transcript_14516/g.31582  ORF Transcript_14516/g.31582 Transcript_14516/m.31582 type:complete len:237 (+) Transcript_14516:100-810(+)|eukprot:CAMPEP_0202902054 /NCGR_PEP_ID=MMETSP1392-20130828/16103_1 /ASSEMBLY_ACC=CAM_ASM_000868 /TAXON_ID=225041 /ORGANISM="Chlamydomonas chlamydogama, Strain SAG 11-48b" /LENGTH=236 /DNA_ID=CAMNT_0049588737 /DNA_START=85 /DNA_END=795 /DNA_ORIENTATION=+
MDLEKAKQAAADAQKTLNEGISVVSKTLLQGACLVGRSAKDVQNQANSALDEGKVYLNQGYEQYKAAEDVFFATAKSGIDWAAANPYVAYPAAGVGSLLLIPFTRRLLYRQTLGRFRNNESTLKSAEGRVEGLKAKMEDYSKEADKLAERMAKAEEEMKRGMAKLKATRLELQRLSAVVGKGQRTAQATMQDLRSLPAKMENVLPLRGEAANQVSALKSQKSKIDKMVRRIAGMDV